MASDSDSDDGLDIIKSTRKGLDLSQYIDVLTQSQTQSPVPDVQPEGDGVGEEEEEESDWLEDEDAPGGYQTLKASKALKRKRSAAETNRVKAQKKNRTRAATSIIGRKIPASRTEGRKSVKLFSTGSEGESDADGPYLEDPTPEYIERRRRKLKMLHEAGLRYPPSYDDIEFSDSDAEEKPVFPKDSKVQRKKRDLSLEESRGVVPGSIARWLRDYQVEGVDFLHERFVKQTGAILGDDMGLGKTIQVIAFLTAAFGKTGTKRDDKLMRKVRRRDDGRWYPRILLVCPGTLMPNWENELEKWGWWQIYKYHGAKPGEKRGILNAARKGMLEIMITTYTTYRNNEGEINTIDWDCVIADECHQIKSKDSEISKAMNKINALCRIGLTGTAVQNRYEELWNLLNWARPGAYGSAQEWKQKISLPLKMGQAHDATQAQLAEGRETADQLVKVILPDVFLRRMKTLIADQLPKKTDRVVFCQLSQEQANAYRTFLASDRCEAIRKAGELCECDSGKSRGHCCHQWIPGENEKWGRYIFPCMVTLQKLANHIGLILPQSTDSDEKQDKDLKSLQLAFPDKYQSLYRIRDSVLKQSRSSFCGKWKVLRRLLDFWQTENAKVLIFSHSVRLLRLLKSLFDLDGTKYNFSYLDGGMSYEDRANAVADFNADPNQFVFLISTKAGGIGLNITSANKVVVMDPNWNPAYDLQAQDRAYRIGQLRDVEVFRLVSAGTIEEVVYLRQIYKQQQANIALTGDRERRYFKGVMGEKDKQGELFGLANLFTFGEENILAREIMNKTTIAEAKIGVDALEWEFNDTQAASDEEDDILSNRSLGLEADDANISSQAKNFVSKFVNENNKQAKKKTPGVDIEAILAKAGVQYTHNNSEVIGHSKIEENLYKQAKEFRHDVDRSRTRVFQASQSQSQIQNIAGEELEYSPDEDGSDDSAVAAARKEVKVHYKYRPSEEIRKRQFCEMARMEGFDDVTAFALVVESMTQTGRSKLLQRFYRRRSRKMAEGFEK